ncbi:helix-turn-helix transcriptional regulator [Litoribrevibacter albus]|uniref:HTH luxR-type domain-containing protein n=1 Tax=Litoribrevibacter albus TaxID=1473156 RepID=A0AA37SG06_9GAMM|nr:helix-turn-helix transcriptional regulator [Litoribrevibacter albus]GLQ33574.1 hypothetical protein GCM10007876_40540 [Litoribrevibacter albus]
MSATADVISRAMEDLIHAMNIDVHSAVCWSGWIDVLVEYSGALEGQLNIPSLNVALTRPVKTEHKSIKQHVSNHYSRNWQVEGHLVELTLCFDQNTVMAERLMWLSQFDDCLLSSLTIGVKHSQYIGQRRLVNLALDTVRLAMLEVDHNSRILHTNYLAKELINDKTISVNAQKLAKLGSSKITDYLSDPLPNEKVSFRYQAGDNLYECMLLYSTDELFAWSRKLGVYYLTLKPLDNSPNAKWLTQGFGLSDSQATVAGWACCGKSAKEISALTGLSVSTVYSYLKAIYKKLGVQSQSQMAAMIWPNIF